MLRKLLLKVIPNEDKQPLEHDLLYNRSTGEIIQQSYVDKKMYMVLYDKKTGQPVRFATDTVIKARSIVNKDDNCFIVAYMISETPNMFEVCEGHFNNTRFFKKNDLIVIDPDYITALEQKVKRLYPDSEVSTLGRIIDYKNKAIEVRQNGNPVIELNVISTKQISRYEQSETPMVLQTEIKKEWVFSHIPAITYNKKIIYITPDEYLKNCEDVEGWEDQHPDII